MPRIRRILMTADTIGGVWTYALDLAAALRPLGIDTVLATMGRHPSADQEHAAARAAGERFEIGRGVQAKAAERLAGFEEKPGVAGVGADDVEYAAAQVCGHLLGQAGHMQVGCADELSGIRCGFSGEETQKRALPRAIGSEQTDAVIAFDVQLDVVQQWLAAEAEADTTETEQWHNTGR